MNQSTYVFEVGFTLALKPLTKDVVEAIQIDQYVPLLVRFCNEGNQEAVALCTHPSRQQDGQVSLLWLRD